MTLAEVREAAAPPEIAAIYAALRAATGVPLVNLIYRHLATMEGVLPWVWAAIRPPLEDGSLAAARDRLAAAVPLPALAPLDAATWRAAGLTPADRTAIAGLVEIYNRGNLTNLLLLTALRQSLDGQQPAASKGASTTAPDPLPAPPPLPRLDALAPGIAALVEGLAARHPGGVVPSLYLHLAHWPQLLAALPAWAGELIEPGAIVAARDAILRLAAMEAATLRPALDGLEAGKPGQPALAAIERFTQQVIPAMVPVGLGLRRLLAQP